MTRRMSRQQPLLWSCLLCVVLATACARHAPTVLTDTTRDSAGVRIVESPAPLWHHGEGWIVDSVPVVSIGSSEGSDAYLFSYITGALRLPDGAIIVADAGAHQLRLFDSTGHFVRAVGQQGSGPGDFGYIEGIARCGHDAIWVNTHFRISVWSFDLQFRREFKTTDDIMWPTICFAGSGLVLKRDIDQGADPTTDVVRVDSLLLEEVDSTGQGRHDLLRIPLWRYVYLLNDKPHVGFPDPFAPATLLAADDSDMIVGDAVALHVEVRDQSGHVLRILRGPADDLALTSALRNAYDTQRLQSRDSEMRTWVRRAGSRISDHLPAYTDIIVDAAGDIWVHRFALPGSAMNRWGVFGADGRFLGDVTLPPKLKVFDIGDNYVLGLRPDSDGVQHVLMYRMRR